MRTGIKDVIGSSITKNVLGMNGIISIIGEDNMGYQEDRTDDERYRRITCQAIANEFRAYKVTTFLCHKFF